MYIQLQKKWLNNHAVGYLGIAFCCKSVQVSSVLFQGGRGNDYRTPRTITYDLDLQNLDQNEGGEGVQLL